MGNLNFIPDPKELDIWINDTTRLNASNMNELRRSVENIREFIVNRNGNGIQTEVNRLTDEVEGNPANTDKKYGSYRTTEKIVKDIYDKQSFHQDTGSPSKLSLFGQDFSNGGGSVDYRTQYLDRTYNAYTELPVKGNSIESSSDYDDTEISSAERDKGLVAAAANTQRYSDYTRKRLIAHENQYRPNSIHFGYSSDNESEAQIEYIKNDGKLVLVPNVEINGATTLGGTLTVSGSTIFKSSVDIGTDELPIQGTNKSSVVVYKTLKEEESRAKEAELKLTNDLASETQNRVEADNQITAAYKEADTKLETKIIGNADDTVEDNTLNGVINYAIAEDEKITAAYTAKDAELQTDIDAINLALSYLADKDVITTEPSFRFGSSNVTTVEVGTNITPNYNITFDDGTYEYGPDPTGSEASAYEVTFNGESLDASSGVFTAVHVTDSTSLTLSAKCTYTDGSTPKNNLGLDYDAGKIVGATKTITKTLKGYRQAFAGGSESKSISVSSLVSSDVRSLVAKGNGKKTFDVTINATDIRVLVAFPSSWGSLKSVLDVNDSSKNIVSAFGSAVTVSVSGATADEDMMDYKLYAMDFASAYGGEGNTYKVTIG